MQAEIAGGGHLDGEAIVATFAGAGDRLAWLVRTFDTLPASGPVREQLYESAGSWVTLAPGGFVLSRTFLRGPEEAPFLVDRFKRDVDLAAAIEVPLPRAGARPLAEREAIVDASRGTLAVLGHFVFCGRQAIDGDTAQVGPQVAEKLEMPQITYAESILSLDVEVMVQRAFEQGSELVKCRLPALLTVVGSANRLRPPSARRRIEYKMAAAPNEYPALLKKYPEFVDNETLEKYLEAHNLKIEVWSAADLAVDESQIGLAGSPTQVYKVNFVVLEATETKEIPATLEGIKAMIEELVKEYIVG